MKYTLLITGIFLLGLIIGVLTLTIGDATSIYNATYDSSKMDSFNKINSTHYKVLEARNKTAETDDPSIIDKIGRFIGRGLDTAQILYSSYDTTETMITDGVESLPIDAPKELFVNALIGVLLIAAVAALIYVMIGRTP